MNQDEKNAYRSFVCNLDYTGSSSHFEKVQLIGTLTLRLLVSLLVGAERFGAFDFNTLGTANSIARVAAVNMPITMRMAIIFFLSCRWFISLTTHMLLTI